LKHVVRELIQKVKHHGSDLAFFHSLSISVVSGIEQSKPLQAHIVGVCVSSFHEFATIGGR